MTVAGVSLEQWLRIIEWIGPRHGLNCCASVAQLLESEQQAGARRSCLSSCSASPPSACSVAVAKDPRALALSLSGATAGPNVSSASTFSARCRLRPSPLVSWSLTLCATARLCSTATMLSEPCDRSASWRPGSAARVGQAMSSASGARWRSAASCSRSRLRMGASAATKLSD